jgi:hypothetical protein
MTAAIAVAAGSMNSGRSQKIGVGGIKMDERSDIANVIGARSVQVDARRWSELLAVFAVATR